MTPKSKRGVVKRYNAIIRQCYRDGRGGLAYGLDMPTIHATWPDRHAEIKALIDLYPKLPS